MDENNSLTPKDSSAPQPEGMPPAPAQPASQPQTVTPQTPQTNPLNAQSAQPQVIQPQSSGTAFPGSPDDTQKVLQTLQTLPTQEAVPQTLNPLMVPPEAPKKKKWLRKAVVLPVALVMMLLVGGAGATYVTVFQNSPGKIWSRAMSNTVEGLDSIVKTSLTAQEKGLKMEGGVKVESPLVAEANMAGQWYEANGSMKLDISAAGAQVAAEVITTDKGSAAAPELYFKVAGLESIGLLLGSDGTSELDSLLATFEDQWFVVDSTLIGQITQMQADAETPTLTQEDLSKISDKLMVVMRDRFFATNEKAVFTMVEKFGKEEFEGTKSYKVKAGINKDNFKSFVTELKDALKDTKIEELVRAGDTTRTFEEILEFDSLITELDQLDFSKATADVWLEARGGFVRNVRVFPEAENTGTYIDFGLAYEGGDVYPMSIKLTLDDADAKGTISLGMGVNSKNSDVDMTVSADLQSSLDGILKMSMNMSLKGTNDEVKVDVPADAVDIMELLSELQQGASSLDLMDPSMGSFDSTEPSLLDDQELQ